MKTDVEALRKKYMDNPPSRRTYFHGHSPYERGRPAGYGLFSK